MLFRSIIASVHLRIVPELRFFIDSSLDEVERLTEILKAHPPLHRESDDEGNTAGADNDNA